MVAYQYCTGRVDTYVSTDLATAIRAASVPYPGEITLSTSIVSSALYLGTCEQYPRVNGGQNWNPWFADQTGNMEPADWEYQNEWKIIALDLNKFVQETLDAITDFGVTSNLTIGQLLQAHGDFFSLWLRFANFGTGIAPPDMPPGEFYPCCRLVEGSYGVLGTRNRTSPVVVRTCPLLTLSNNSTLTYSTDPEWFAMLPDPDNPND